MRRLACLALVAAPLVAGCSHQLSYPTRQGRCVQRDVGRIFGLRVDTEEHQVNCKTGKWVTP